MLLRCSGRSHGLHESETPFFFPADCQTRRKGISILAKAADSLQEASNGDAKAVKALGNDLLVGLGSMLNGFSGDDEGDDGDEGNQQDEV